MTQELTIPKDERPVLMRSGLVHWVSMATAERIQQVLAVQTGHSFINVSEKGITVNTADVEGVYTLEQFEDLAKVKQGMFQCEYQVWHAKRETCDCKAEARRRHEAAMKKAAEARDHRPLTEEEKKKSREAMHSIGDELRRRGIFGPSSRPMQNDRTCRMCPTKLTGHLQWYCSGGCVGKAKEDGSYGQEEIQK